MILARPEEHGFGTEVLGEDISTLASVAVESLKIVVRRRKLAGVFSFTIFQE